jgi:signal transduction histidine kinase/CheY-like chemotaxis protein
VAERTQALERQTHDAQAAASALRVQEQIERGYSELAELLNSLDRSHILEHGTAKIAASLDAPVAAVYLTSSGPDTLRLKTYTVVDPTALRTPHLSATGLPHEVARRKAPVILSLREETERIMLATGVGEIPIHTIAGVPLTYQDRLLGVLVVATLTPLSEHARAFLDNAARQLSVALSNAGLFESTRYQSQQMEQLNAALKRASDVKSEFLASMSHELRTPLNSIIGFTELLLSGGRDQLAPRHRAALEKVLASGRHLLGLINDILDLSKIEAGRMEMRPEPVRVAALAEECLSVIQPQARVKALPVELGEIDPDLTIQQDRGKLKQILLNLLSNAVKFTSEGRIELRAEGHGDELAIAVTDTGVGILLEDQGRMFEPFQQADSSRSRGVGGTGLGLAISRRLAHVMGGTLTLQSEVGRGSVFTLRIPRRYVPAPAGEPELDPAGSAAPSDDVLVIDDDRDVVEIIRQAVAGESFTVGWEPTAASGLARARGRRPSAILLDVMLQGQDDGWDVLHALKSDPQTRHIPVVIHSVIDNPHRARELGANEILVKPTPAAEIKALLRGYLGGNGTSRPEAIRP